MKSAFSFEEKWKEKRGPLTLWFKSLALQSARGGEYSNLYLHVDPDNKAALSLYEKEGYLDVGRRWNAKWNAGANQIGYYTKKLKLKEWLNKSNKYVFKFYVDHFKHK